MESAKEPACSPLSSSECLLSDSILETPPTERTKKIHLGFRENDTYHMEMPSNQDATRHTLKDCSTQPEGSGGGLAS